MHENSMDWDALMLQSFTQNLSAARTAKTLGLFVRLISLMTRKLMCLSVVNRLHENLVVPFVLKFCGTNGAITTGRWQDARHASDAA